MKLRNMSYRAALPVAVVTAVIIITSFGLIAWAGGPGDPGNKISASNDTIPQKIKGNSDKDFDKELRELDEAMEQLDDLKRKDWNKLRKELDEAIEKINVDKISVDVDQAIAKIDFEKIGREIEASLSKIDFDKIAIDVDRALDEVKRVDKEKIKEEIERARDEVQKHLKNKEWNLEIEEAKMQSSKEIRKALEKAKEEMMNAKENLNREKFDIKEQMEKAQVEVEKAREELKGFKEMVNDMEKAGLLNTSSDYKIEYRNGDILIDGKKLSPEVTAKYRKYFKRENVTIRKEDGALDIDVD